MDLRVTFLLLMLSRAVCMTDLSNNLHCVTDYMYTITCNLTTDLSPKSLQLKDIDDESFKCNLSRQIDHFFCTVEISFGFVDVDVYKILVCYDEDATNCTTVNENYRPLKTIKPKPPCCLTWSQNSSQHSFTWKSTYETLSTSVFPKALKYELCFHRIRQECNVPHIVKTAETTFTIQDDSNVFKPDCEYAAKVRSGPNNASFKGQWSDWSTEIYWRTLPIVEESSPFFLHVKKMLIPVCVLVPFLLISCFIPVLKWGRKMFIPTPEPYFHTLYTECQGDFKSWVVMEKTVELPKTERTLHIDKIFERVEAPGMTQSCFYANLGEPEGAVPDPGFPFEESTLGLDSATASCTSAYLSPPSRSLGEGDSGCWLSSDHSLERGPPWYCNDYCTLSTFQQSALCSNELLKCGTHSNIGLEDEIDLIC